MTEDKCVFIGTKALLLRVPGGLGSLQPLGPFSVQNAYAEGSWNELIADLSELACKQEVAKYPDILDSVRNLMTAFQAVNRNCIAQLYFFNRGHSVSGVGANYFHIDQCPTERQRVFWRIVWTALGAGTILHPAEVDDPSRAREVDALQWSETDEGWAIQRGWAVVFACGPRGAVHKSPKSQEPRVGAVLTGWDTMFSQPSDMQIIKEVGRKWTHLTEQRR